MLSEVEGLLPPLPPPPPPDSLHCVGHSVSVCCVVYGWQLQQTSMWNRMVISSMLVCWLNVWDTVCLSVVLCMVGNSSRPPCGTGWLHQACLFAAKCVGHSVSVSCFAYGWKLQQTSMWNRMVTSSMFVCC